VCLSDGTTEPKVCVENLNTVLRLSECGIREINDGTEGVSHRSTVSFDLHWDSKPINNNIC